MDIIKKLTRASTVLAGLATISACSSVGLGGPFQADRNFDNRIYAGGGILASSLEPDTDAAPGVSVDSSGSGGGSLLLGYDLNNRFSVEGHVADLGDADLAPDGSVSYQVAGLSALVYGLNGESARAQRRGLSGFGRLGLGALDNDSEGVDFDQVNDFHLLIGAGAEYGFNNGLAARAELVAHDEDARYVQLALLYRFGTDNRRRVNPPQAPKIEVPVVPPTVDVPVVVTPAPLPDTRPVERIAPVVIDSDNDGVPDTLDSCADTSVGNPVDDAGCSLFDGVIEGVNFKSGSDELTPEAEVVLMDVVTKLDAFPDVKLAIKAHTDNSGEAVQNLRLSRRRALSVASYFVEQGIRGSRLRPQAFGESEPIETNETAEGRAANRRVEFSVVQ